MFTKYDVEETENAGSDAETDWPVAKYGAEHYTNQRRENEDNEEL